MQNQWGRKFLMQHEDWTKDLVDCVVHLKQPLPSAETLQRGGRPRRRTWASDLSAVRPARRPIFPKPPSDLSSRPIAPSAVRTPSAEVKPPSAVVKPPSAVDFSKSPDAGMETSTSSGRPDANVSVPASEQPCLCLKIKH